MKTDISLEALIIGAQTMPGKAVKLLRSETQQNIRLINNSEHKQMLTYMQNSCSTILHVEYISFYACYLEALVLVAS